MPRTRLPSRSLVRAALVALTAFALAGCVVEPGYYRPAVYVRPGPVVWGPRPWGWR